jgi:hypothetical protein
LHFLSSSAFDTPSLFQLLFLQLRDAPEAARNVTTNYDNEQLSFTHDTMADKLGQLKPQKKIELYSGNYFAACTIGGIVACGPTHTMVTPLDLVSMIRAQQERTRFHLHTLAELSTNRS